MKKFSWFNARKLFFLFCAAVLAAVVAGCAPGARGVQGEQIPFTPGYWTAKYSMGYSITDKKKNAHAGELVVSAEPVGKDKTNISLNLKNGGDTAEVGALLISETLMPVTVTKEVVMSGRKLKLQSDYQGRSLRVSMQKGKRKKNLFFEIPSKIYYDNDVFLILLQSVDFDKLKEILDAKKKDKDKVRVALANPQIGQVPDAEMHISWKPEKLLIAGKEVPCLHIELHHGKLLVHHAWYEQKLPHRLLKVETPKEIFMLKSFYKKTVISEK